MIESIQNPKIKALVKIQQSNAERRKENKIIVEGRQENTLALSKGYEPLEFYICSTIFPDALPSQAKVHLVSEKVYEKIAYRGGTEGIVGVYRSVEHSLGNYTPCDAVSIIVVEGSEKPGNLGAIIRSCEALGIDSLIITDPKTDLYNPNVIRSSVGCVFLLKIFTTTNEELHNFLEKNRIALYTTDMHTEARAIDSVDFTRSCALLFGTEHSGISTFWKKKGQNVLIPMHGTIDSLNLSNAVAISAYEMQRQKTSSRQSL
ncbi:TrmH family RNA methyltransferase [Planobacterium oryzisoli]|uniref:RNA methyltransferase n=1 Tax=Planobacterium oryzisoli TaxID=2771435 RepID=A0A931E6U4_9FLAO|nr:TrmH family RNA methyltransferase [Planobacterium oryzisoli]MBF5026811.1 RNA methyltransferase [Planobacterium oryzisoli]